jgi:hypothetical protein
MLLLATVWIGSRPIQDPMPNAMNGQQEPIQIESDLPVLENYDVLSNFEALTDLPDPVQGDDAAQQDSDRQPM